jgi:linoleate 10R-lipoxygenase
MLACTLHRLSDYILRVDSQLEKLVVVMSRLPEGSPFAKNLEHALISIRKLVSTRGCFVGKPIANGLVVYADLPHPPSGYLSLPETHRLAEVNRLPYAFRAPDGSFHNILFPSLGRAGSPYARSVPSTKLPTAPLPDAGLVFDTLLRREKFESHPGGLSGLFFAFANLIIHSIFDTDHQDCTVNNASSYLDLSPLYGSSAEKMGQVRRKDGTGQLWEDVFADSRLLLMPPSICALTILFCRNHNVRAFSVPAVLHNTPDCDPVHSRQNIKHQRARVVLFPSSH